MDKHKNKDKISGLRKRANVVKTHRCKNLVVVLENPKSWKNIGAAIRNVNALGAEKVYVIDPKNQLPDDWQQMRDHTVLSKSSASAVKWSFIKRFNDTESCINHLERFGFRSIATSPHVKDKVNIELSEGDYTRPKKLAVWFGNESFGISDMAIESCDYCISIPMFGIIESLNLGTSTGIVLYEITKQRRSYQYRLARLIAEKKSEQFSN